MEEQFSRTRLLLGDEGIEKLKSSRVCIFGIGGVGGYVAEALARSGVGRLVLVDNDKVSLSNLNRQIIALRSTIGRYKVDVMRERILDINPDAEVSAIKCFFLPETAGDFNFRDYDYVVDAVDTVTAKLEIVMQAKKCGTAVISCMGAGNKLDAGAFLVSDIYKSSVCPLARVMRNECRKRGIKELKIVYSKERARKSISTDKAMELSREDMGSTVRKAVPGSIAFVPSAAGLLIAGEVVRDILKIQ